MSDISATLADGLQGEVKRVQELIPLYEEIPTGAFAAAMMRQSINNAMSASISADVVSMIRAYEDLKGYKL